MKSAGLAIIGAALAGSALCRPENVSVHAPPQAEFRLSTGSPAVLEVFDGVQFVAIGSIDRLSHTWLPGETPERHGANGHCAAGSDDTKAVQEFLDALSDGGSGSWNGCYYVDPGALVLTPSAHARLASTGAFKSFAAPHISGNAVFVGRSGRSGPFLSIFNPQQTSGNGAFYAGGSIGNLTFIDPSVDKSAARHGLSLRGVYDWSFGQIIGQGLGGAALNISRETVNGDPDAYGSGKNQIAAIICTGCGRPAFDAETLGEGGEQIGFLAAYGSGMSDRSQGNGAMVNAGQATSISSLSALLTRGWGIVFGGPHVHGSRQSIRGIELDATEEGIWVGALITSELWGRIIYDPVPGLGAVWPRAALKLGGMDSQVRDTTIHLIVRVDPGTRIGDLARDGNIVDLSNDPKSHRR